VSTRDRIDPELLPGLDGFLEASGPRGLAGISDVSVRRAKFAEMMAAGAADGDAAGDEGVESEDRLVPGDPDVPVRVYRPAGASGTLPALLYIHGGGFEIGSIDTEDPIARMLSREVTCVVVSVEYRLAPEHRYPAQVDDCYAGLRWMVAQAEELRIDAARIGVYGGSAGGGLSAATALMARDKGGPALAIQMLLYPMLDDRCGSASSLEISDLGLWDGWANVEAWAALLGEEAGTAGVSPLAAPARAGDLAGLPPAYIDVGELDSLRDEDVEYAVRLARAGVPTELHLYPGAYHAWELFGPDAAVSTRVVTERIGALRRALQSG
jgi:acetyl esterase/lipase